jgi:hypothetical protein
MRSSLSMTWDRSVVFYRSSTNTNDRYDIAKISLEVALDTIKQTNKQTNKLNSTPWSRFELTTSLWLFNLDPVVFLLPKRLDYLTFQSFKTKSFQRTNSVKPTNCIERKWRNQFTKCNRRRQRNKRKISKKILPKLYSLDFFTFPYFNVLSKNPTLSILYKKQSRCDP